MEASALPTQPQPKSEAEVVLMDDGRKVEFSAKKRKIVTVSLTDDGVYSAQVDFRNGKTLGGVLHPSLVPKTTLHGLKQKVTDEDSGLTAIEDSFLAIEELLPRLANGDWGADRGAGDSLSGASIIIRALVELTSKTGAEVKALLQEELDSAKARGEDLTRQGLYKSFLRLPEVKTIVDRLESEKVTKGSKVDAAALLGRMGSAAA